MSVESITLALHHSRSKGTTRLVLVGIANHDGDGGAWPSLATLMTYSGMSLRSVQYAVRELEQLGEVTVALQDGGARDTPSWKRPNRYLVHLRCPTNCDRSSRHRCLTCTEPASSCHHGCGAEGCSPLHPGGAARCTRGVQPVAPESLLEPSLEPPGHNAAVQSPSARVERPVDNPTTTDPSS